MARKIATGPTKPPPKRRVGRPTKCTPETAHKICKRIAAGESLRRICRDADMPTISVVMDWALGAQGETFPAQYANARRMQAELMADELLDIADDGSNDWMEREGGADGQAGYAVNGEVLARSRLRVDTRKWIVCKMLPKVYGDKHRHEHGGLDGKPLPTSIEIRYVGEDSADPE